MPERLLGPRMPCPLSGTSALRDADASRDVRRALGGVSDWLTLVATSSHHHPRDVTLPGQSPGHVRHLLLSQPT